MGFSILQISNHPLHPFPSDQLSTSVSSFFYVHYHPSSSTSYTVLVHCPLQWYQIHENQALLIFRGRSVQLVSFGRGIFGLPWCRPQQSVTVAGLHFTGDVALWFKWYKLHVGSSLWAIFTKCLLKYFGSGYQLDFNMSLSCLPKRLSQGRRFHSFVLSSPGLDRCPNFRGFPWSD